MRDAFVLALVLTWSLFQTGPRPLTADDPQPCRQCGWLPPVARETITVGTVTELHEAAARVRPQATILLKDGEYRLLRTIDLRAPGVTMRGLSGDPARVVLRGDGMNETRVGVAVSVSAPDVTLADFTVSDVAYHGVQVRGESGASHATIHRLHIVDTGQQLIKGSSAGGPLYADDGLVACSTLEYRVHAPSDYTNAIDILAGRGWVVRDNVIRRIRGPQALGWAAGPAVLFWANSLDTVVAGNRIVDSYRGIAFGLGRGASGPLARGGEPTLDHQGGVIRDNVIVNPAAWADEGIEVNAGQRVLIERNTVLTAGRLPWSISIRFRESSAVVRQNVTSRPVSLRDGARAILTGNRIRPGPISQKP